MSESRLYFPQATFGPHLIVPNGVSEGPFLVGEQSPEVHTGAGHEHWSNRCHAKRMNKKASEVVITVVGDVEADRDQG